MCGSVCVCWCASLWLATKSPNYPFIYLILFSSSDTGPLFFFFFFYLFLLCFFFLLMFLSSGKNDWNRLCQPVELEVPKQVVKLCEGLGSKRRLRKQKNFGERQPKESREATGFPNVQLNPSILVDSSPQMHTKALVITVTTPISFSFKQGPHAVY